MFELSDLPAEFDFSSADWWHVTLLSHGVPVEAVELPSPGLVDARFIAATFGARAGYACSRLRLIDNVRRRMGIGTARPELVASVSVIMCTHRRPEQLRRALESLSKLDPAPTEVVIVDNDPGAHDCEALVTETGFTYAREDRRGLDNARNAGLNVATGELVAFTDDDCVLSPGWLSTVPALFEDPSVGAVTGPMFPYRLDSQSQVEMERLGGMTRGFIKLLFDWHTISVVHAGAIGVGANMIFRRSVLDEIGAAPFPPELDAGTITESGGDTYAISRVVANGHRIIYAPEVYGFHDHRPDPASLKKAIRGYGIGISAAMSKLLVEHRELEAWRGWWWLVHQYVRVLRQRIDGRVTSAELKLSREYITGGILGISRWRRARQLAAEAPTPSPAPAVNRDGSHALRRSIAASAEDRPVRLSVVIPTIRWSDALRRCVESLERQTVEREEFEVILVDDRVRPEGAADGILGGERVLRSRGAGASAARNLGAREARAPVVLFIDDDMVADPLLIERHLAAHERQQSVAVVGSYWPRPVEPGLMASSVALWWNDAFEGMRHAVQPTFTWLLTGNLSVPREEFLGLGGFAHDIPYRREDWEFGIRWLNAGFPIAYARDAATDHDFTVHTQDRLRGAELEGFGDARIAQRHPGTAGVLPLIGHRPLRSGGVVRRLVHQTLCLGPVVHVGLSVLGVLEAGHLRLAWLRVLRRFQSSAYKHGLERAGFEAQEAVECVRELELLSDEPIAFTGPVPPTLSVQVAGREVTRVRPREGFWGPEVAELVAGSLDPSVIERVGGKRAWIPGTRDDLTATRTFSVDRVEIERGELPEQWLSAADRIRNGRGELVAVTLGRAPNGNERWLGEALVPFAGQRVGAAFGINVGDDDPSHPIYVHDAAVPPRLMPGEAPRYLVIRRSALDAVGGLQLSALRWGDLGPVMAMIHRVLASDLLVARRDVHGLDSGRYPAREQGRAWAAARQDGQPRDVISLAGRSVAVVAPILWEGYKRRGRIGRPLLEETLGAVEGTWVGQAWS